MKTSVFSLQARVFTKLTVEESFWLSLKLPTLAVTSFWPYAAL